MRFLIPMLAILWASSGWAMDVIVKDGDTIQLAGITYHLDGIDAPEFDQVCIDNHADPWECGVDARDHLAQLIGKRDVSCEDLGPDKVFRKWPAAICIVAGETISLNQSMVRQGFALNFEPSVKGRFAEDQADAKKNRRGLWEGCFAAPQAFRRGEKKTAALLGAACRSDKDLELRQALFPAEPAAPPNCTIKAKFALRARITGNVGIYHLQGCRSYAPLTNPDRWFCTEEDAQAAGFRRAYNCRPSPPRK
jgi:endonuclease YncB( thermonuclease family)